MWFFKFINRTFTNATSFVITLALIIVLTGAVIFLITFPRFSCLSLVDSVTIVASFSQTIALAIGGFWAVWQFFVAGEKPLRQLNSAFVSIQSVYEAHLGVYVYWEGAAFTASIVGSGKNTRRSTGERNRRREALKRTTSDFLEKYSREVLPIAIAARVSIEHARPNIVSLHRRCLDLLGLIETDMGRLGAPKDSTALMTRIESYKERIRMQATELLEDIGELTGQNYVPKVT